MNDCRFGNKKRLKLFKQPTKFKYKLANLCIKKNEIQKLNNETDNVSEISNNQVKSYSIMWCYNYFKTQFYVILCESILL